ncbi:MAG: tetratricopeptide repeat protein [Desulfatibacillum sp.]|nr:tetratricopeptide repeat protein [Desulfatibacillum sp.]
MDLYNLPNELLGAPLALWIILTVVWAVILIVLFYVLKNKVTGKNPKATEFSCLEVRDFVSAQPGYAIISTPPEVPLSKPAGQQKPSKPKGKAIALIAMLFVIALIVTAGLNVYRTRQVHEYEIRESQRAAMQAAEIQRKLEKPAQEKAIAPEKPKDKPSETPFERTMVQEALKFSQEGAQAFRDGNFEQAEEMFRQSLTLVQKAGDLGGRARIAAYNNLASALEKQNRDDEAEVYYLRAIDDAMGAGKPDDMGIAHAKQGLVRIHARQGRLDNVEALYDDAIRIWDIHRGAGNTNSVGLMLEKARFLDAIGKTEKAAQMREQAGQFQNSIEMEASPKSNWGKDGAQVINLSVALKFKPTAQSSNGPNGAWIPGTDMLSPIRPAAIIKEPQYQGIERRYGGIELGVPAHAYYFALDRSNGPHPVIYFDSNRNGDLEDDGPPILNNGDGFFSASVSIPLSLVHERYKGADDFKLWFYMRESDWDGAASHYSQTQLHGNVEIAEKNYTAYLVETRINDGDFTNDGIYLDIDKDGKIDSRTEHIGFGQTLDLEGRSYRFMITP